MQGGTAVTQEVFIAHVGIPILAAIRPAVQDLGMHRKVQLIVCGGIGTAALVALGDNDLRYQEECEKLGSLAGAWLTQIPIAGTSGYPGAKGY